MVGSFGGIPTSIPPTGSSSIPTPDVVTASDVIPASNLSEPLLLSSTRIEVSRAVDRATLDAAIDSIYLRLDLHQAILDRYWSMDTSLAQQAARNYQLDENLQGLCTYASPFVEYVQARYARLRVQYDKKFKKYDSFREALAERVDQNALI